MPADPEIDAFYAEHAAGGPGNVVAVRAQRKDGSERIGIFSSIGKARAWSASLSEDEYEGSVFVPYVIDVPEYGNVPEGEQQ